jgi:hypothetical protein
MPHTAISWFLTKTLGNNNAEKEMLTASQVRMCKNKKRTQAAEEADYMSGKQIFSHLLS